MNAAISLFFAIEIIVSITAKGASVNGRERAIVGPLSMERIKEEETNLTSVISMTNFMTNFSLGLSRDAEARIAKAAEYDFKKHFGDSVKPMSVAISGIAGYKLSIKSKAEYQEFLEKHGVAKKHAKQWAKDIDKYSEKLKVPGIALAVAAGGAGVSVYKIFDGEAKAAEPGSAIILLPEKPNHIQWWVFVTFGVAAFLAWLLLVHVGILRKG